MRLIQGIVLCGGSLGRHLQPSCHTGSAFSFRSGGPMLCSRWKVKPLVGLAPASFLIVLHKCHEHQASLTMTKYGWRRRAGLREFDPFPPTWSATYGMEVSQGQIEDQRVTTLDAHRLPHLITDQHKSERRGETHTDGSSAGLPLSQLAEEPADRAEQPLPAAASRGCPAGETTSGTDQGPSRTEVCPDVLQFFVRVPAPEPLLCRTTFWARAAWGNVSSPLCLLAPFICLCLLLPFLDHPKISFFLYYIFLPNVLAFLKSRYNWHTILVSDIQRTELTSVYIINRLPHWVQLPSVSLSPYLLCNWEFVLLNPFQPFATPNPSTTNLFSLSTTLGFVFFIRFLIISEIMCYMSFKSVLLVLLSIIP